MKKTLLFLIGFAFLFIVIGMSNSLLESTINPLLKDNIEALADDEWGGGHGAGSGPITWYEYARVEYWWQTEGGRTYWCEAHTCQGYGDLYCDGYITCN